MGEMVGDVSFQRHKESYGQCAFPHKLLMIRMHEPSLDVGVQSG